MSTAATLPTSAWNPFSPALGLGAPFSAPWLPPAFPQPYSLPQSFSALPPLPPPPEQVAPCVYTPCFQPPKPPTRPVVRPPVIQPIAQPRVTAPPPIRTPLPPPPRPMMQPPPVMQPPPPPPPVQPPPQPPPTPPPVTEKKAPEKLDTGALSDTAITDLNKRLNDTDEAVRAAASTDLINLLQKNPSLAEDPQTQATVDAFLQKILQDPSELVRTGGEVALQAGLDKKPSPELLALLQGLAGRAGSLTKEDKAASGILTSLANGFKDSQNQTATGTSGPTDASLSKGEASKPETSPPTGPQAPATSPQAPQSQPVGVQQNSLPQAGGVQATSQPAFPPSQPPYHRSIVAPHQPPYPPTPPQIPPWPATGQPTRIPAGWPPGGKPFNTVSPAPHYYYPGVPTPGGPPTGQRLNLVEGRQR